MTIKAPNTARISWKLHGVHSAPGLSMTTETRAIKLKKEKKVQILSGGKKTKNSICKVAKTRKNILPKYPSVVFGD